MLAQLAQAVRERTLSRGSSSCSESVDRIDRLNPALNAVTEVWSEEALAQAESVDERGAEGPLAGLPLLVKDNTDVAGKVTSYASRTMLDRPPAERSEVTVERMVAAGAIPIGRTNLPEFAFQGYTDSKRVRAGAKPVGPRVVARGLVRWLGRGPRRRPRPDRHRRRRRRLDPNAGRVLRPGRPQADERADRTAADPVVDGLLDAGAARGEPSRTRSCSCT